MTALALPVRPYPHVDVVAALARVGPCTVAQLARHLPYADGTIRSKLYGAEGDGVVAHRKRGLTETQVWYVVRE